jgi:hypothetical protein
MLGSDDLPGYSSSLGRTAEELPELVIATLKRFYQLDPNEHCGFVHKGRTLAASLQRIRASFGMNQRTEVITLRQGLHLFRMTIYPKGRPFFEVIGPGWEHRYPQRLTEEEMRQREAQEGKITMLKKWEG